MAHAGGAEIWDAKRKLISTKFEFQLFFCEMGSPTLQKHLLWAQSPFLSSNSCQIVANEYLKCWVVHHPHQSVVRLQQFQETSTGLQCKASVWKKITIKNHFKLLFQVFPIHKYFLTKKYSPSEPCVIGKDCQHRHASDRRRDPSLLQWGNWK